MYKIGLIAPLVILVFLRGVSPFLGNFLPTKTYCTCFQGDQATENRHLKPDLLHVWHIYKSDREGNTEFSLEVGYTFCEGEAWCKPAPIFVLNSVLMLY